MTFTKFPIMSCTFCYKSVTQIGDGENLKNIEVCNTFCKNLNSFVKPSSLQAVVSCELVCCKDCEFLIGEFCEVLKKIKCLELQLQRKLETLMKVMKSADKVPSRVKALEQIFNGIETNSEMSKESQLQLIKETDGSVSDQSAYQLFRKLRQDIISQCCRSRNIPQLQPRVMLKRLAQVEKGMKNTKSRQFSDIGTKANSIESDFVIGWLMSFGAVVFLQSLYSDFCTEQIADDKTALFENEDSNGNNLEEILENEEDTKTVQLNFLIENNDTCEDNGFDQSPQPERVENLLTKSKSIVTQETETDSSSVTSEENPVETMDLKAEDRSEVNPINPSDMPIHDINQKSFSCHQCSASFITQKSLSSHLKWRHRLPKWKAKKPKQIFSCALCKTSYHTYQILRKHKVSAIHRFLERKKLMLGQNLDTVANIKSEQISQVPSESTKLVENRHEASSTKEDASTSKSIITKLTQPNLLRYNLRLRKKTQNDFGCDNENDLNSDTDTNYLEDTDSDGTSSSEESNVKDDHVNEEDKECNTKSSHLYRCLLDDCKLKRVVFSNNSKLDQHKKLHIRGQYHCKFCDKVEVTPISLSLHETEMHSAIPSTSTNLKNIDGIFYCSRCSFETQREGVYFKHFFSTHLEGSEGETRKSLWECAICKKKFVSGKNRSKIHFKTHHDTSGIEDPDHHVHKCRENGCSAYFLSKEQLRIHKVSHHSSPNSINQLDELVNEMIETNDETGFYKCAFCPKESNQFFQIRKHVRMFHYQMLTNHEEKSARTKNGKRIICPEVKCTKTFETFKGLEVHMKFHGTFACLFCGDIKNYATDLAMHECEVHTPQINTKDQHVKFKCSRCSKIYNHKLYYTNHFVNEHLSISTIQAICSICQFQCHNESLRSHHLRNHYTAGMDPEKVLKCIKCTAYFRTDKQLARHIEKIHKDPIKLILLKCTKCDASFQNHLHLKHHLSKEHQNSNINSKFKCNQCTRCFARELSLKRHVLQFHGKQSDKSKDIVQFRHICLLDRCKRKFKDKVSLDLHQNLHKLGVYSCKFCGISVDSILKLSLHENVRHPNSKGKSDRERFYYCSRCPYKDISALRYQTHFAEAHIGIVVKPKSALNIKLLGKYKCNFCETETSSSLELGYHEADHVNKKSKTDDGSTLRIQCPRCSKSYKKMFYIKHYLKVHFDGLTKGKQTVCPICQEKATRQKDHFRKYHNTEDLEDPLKVYKCEDEDDMCKAYFIKYEQLIQHKKLRHPALEWTCQDCGKSYKTESSYKSHRRDFHLNILKNPRLQFLCDVQNCQRGFETKEELGYHKKFGRCHKKSNELGNAKLKCDKCNKEFSSKVKLKSHVIKVHTEPSFICQECGKKFRTKAILKSHLEYHKGPEAWKFQCSTCGKKCVSKYTLSAHLRTHTGEKPYVCQYCGEKYAHVHNWKNHMLTKHKNQEDLPEIRKTSNTNRLSRKGTKKGDCVIAEAKQ